MLPSLFSTLGMIFVLRDARAQSVSQPDHHTSVSEKASLELRCKYVYAATPSLFWYVQYPRQGLQLLLKNLSGKTLVQGIKGFEAEFKKNESSFNLRKSSAHLRDSAVYFCAVSDTVPEAAGGAEHKPLIIVELSETFKDTKDSRGIFKDLTLYDSKRGKETCPDS